MISTRKDHMKMHISDARRKSSSESSVSWCIFSLILLAVGAAISIFFAVTRGVFDGESSRIPDFSDVRLPGQTPSAVRHEQRARPPGFFIEIGTSSSQVWADTRVRHLEKKGFTGVCAVPFPGDFSDRKCKVIALPVSGASGEKVTVQDCSNRPPQNLEGLISNLVKPPTDCPEVETNTLGIVDLLSLAAAPAVVDFLALDANGTTLAILKNFPFEDFCVRSWVVKHNYHDTMAQIRHVLEVAMGCRVSELSVEYWARCPCSNSVTDTGPVTVTKHAQVHEETESAGGHRDGDGSVVSIVTTADAHQVLARRQMNQI